MMLICICSAKKCYDALKILYFESKSFIIQKHIDMLAYMCAVAVVNLDNTPAKPFDVSLHLH